VVALPLLEPVPPQEKFLVYEVETDSYISSYLHNASVEEPYSTTLSVQPFERNTDAMMDGEADTYVNFPITEGEQNKVTITLNASRPISTSRLHLQLSQFVALPQTIEIKAGIQNTDLFTVIAEKKMTSTTVTFPQVTADVFEVTFTYSQLLRISEFSFLEDVISTEMQQSLRFLAQPNTSYKVFYNADRPVSVSVMESGNLISTTDILTISTNGSQANRLYVPADVDADGIRDTLDNCVHISNFNQLDINVNGRGDACDDFDGDGFLNTRDNCINIPNRAQSDEDNDGFGDACDEVESRFTEQNAWMPWVGMGTAVVVMITLFALVARGRKKDIESEEKEETVE
jgi:hypothetical protein